MLRCFIFFLYLPAAGALTRVYKGTGKIPTLIGYFKPQRARQVSKHTHSYPKIRDHVVGQVSQLWLIQCQLVLTIDSAQPDRLRPNLESRTKGVRTRGKRLNVVNGQERLWNYSSVTFVLRSWRSCKCRLNIQLLAVAELVVISDRHS